MRRKMLNFKNDLKLKREAESPYIEKPMYNATSLYYVTMADIMRSTFLCSINRNLTGFIISMYDLIDVCTPAALKLKQFGIIDRSLKKMAEVEMQAMSISKNVGVHRDTIEKDVYSKLRSIRRELLNSMGGILVATSSELSPLGKLKEAFGLNPWDDIDDEGEVTDEPDTEDN